MKSTRIFLCLAAGPMMVLAACAQAPGAAPALPPPADAGAPPPAAANAPPPPADPALPAGPSTTYSSRVRTVIYGSRGDAQALVLRNGVSVTLSPDMAMRMGSAVSRGTRVQVSGPEQVFGEQKSVAAQSVTANGQTYVAQPTPARPEAGPAGTMAAAAPAPPPPPPPPGAGPRPRRRGPGAVPPPPPPPDGAAGPPPPPPQN